MPDNTESSDISSSDVSELLSEYDIREIESSVVHHYVKEYDVDDDFAVWDYVESMDETKSDNIISSLNNEVDLTLDDVLRVFELLSENRKVNGIYYTPRTVTDYIVENTVEPSDTVFDFASGGGAFLLKITEYIYKETDKSVTDIVENQIFGSDIIQNNVRQSKILLCLFAVSNGEEPSDIDFNIVCEDSLLADWANIFEEATDGFDSVVGNPPYVKIQKMDDELKQELTNQYETVDGGNFNMYIPFMELAVNVTNSNGRVGLITPLNYFTTITGKDLREFLQSNKLVRRIVDFGERLLFEDALIYTAITIMDKKRKGSLEYIRMDEDEPMEDISSKEIIDINYSSLDPDKWRLLSGEEYKNVDKIESYRRLDDVAGIHTGIATLKDAVYTIKDCDESGRYYHTEFEGEEYPIEKEATRELVKISKIDDESSLKQNSRRIIFPYKMTDKQKDIQGNIVDADFEIIDPEELEDEYPKTYEYLEVTEDKLGTREKGDGENYDPWYKYGRKQGIDKVGVRMYTPTYSDGPNFMLHRNEQSLFNNGYAVFPDKIEAEVLQKILNSKIMDYYMNLTSKDIQGGYQCYQKNFIRKFSVPELSEDQKDQIQDKDGEELEHFITELYDVDIKEDSE